MTANGLTDVERKGYRRSQVPLVRCYLQVRQQQCPGRRTTLLMHAGYHEDKHAEQARPQCEPFDLPIFVHPQPKYRGGSTPGSILFFHILGRDTSDPRPRDVSTYKGQCVSSWPTPHIRSPPSA